MEYWMGLKLISRFLLICPYLTYMQSHASPKRYIWYIILDDKLKPEQSLAERKTLRIPMVEIMTTYKSLQLTNLSSRDVCSVAYGLSPLYWANEFTSNVPCHSNTIRIKVPAIADSHVVFKQNLHTEIGRTNTIIMVICT